MTGRSRNTPPSHHLSRHHCQHRPASPRFMGTLLALPLGLCLSSNTIAQTTETPAAIDETVIVASRVTDLSHQVGVSVSVLDRDDILSLGYPDLGSLLDTQPGVTVTMDGGFGKAAAVRIRGEEGFRTRIVLDGINIADPSSPQISPR
ncbi:MAG: TonB-dependent receptor plug domain-containing protein, partial [Halieaceae bacterium]|nr:TonB-dependent receptor plug domain-containing protein [Halieaceae bacterium]